MDMEDQKGSKRGGKKESLMKKNVRGGKKGFQIRKKSVKVLGLMRTNNGNNRIDGTRNPSSKEIAYFRRHDHYPVLFTPHSPYLLDPHSPHLPRFLLPGLDAVEYLERLGRDPATHQLCYRPPPLKLHLWKWGMD